VPHISLVFREMWDTTALSLWTLDSSDALTVNIGGIPHLAKNERDMGHPSLVREPGAPLITAVCLGLYCFDLGVESVTAQQVWQVLGEG
jgi:hypothetical protein